jgi:acyl-CoA thioester hydrolase
MDSAISPLLSGYPIVVTLPVQWGEQDMYGHVNNTVYFRWYETARIAYAEKVGLPEMTQTLGVGPILAAINCNYRRQVRYPDTIQIGARVTRLGRTSLTMEHHVVSAKQGVLVADGDSTIVCFNYRDQKPVPVPDTLRAAIEKLEGKPL